MTYNNAIPQASDLLSVSQSQILTNFSQLDTVFSQDHVNYNDGTVANRGKHNLSTYREQSTGPTTLFNEIGVFTQEVAGTTQLFYMPENSTDGSQVQMTFPSTDSTNGTFVFAGGIRMQWGTGTILAGGATLNVTFPVAFNAAPYSLVASLHGSPSSDASRGFGTDTITASTFRATNFNSTFTPATNFSWIAIGPV